MTRLHGPDEGHDDAPRPATLGERLDRGRRPDARPAPAGPRLGSGIRAGVAAGRRARSAPGGSGSTGTRPAGICPPSAGARRCRPASRRRARRRRTSSGRPSPPSSRTPRRRRNEPASRLPVDVRARLADVAGPGAAAMRVRADARRRRVRPGDNAPTRSRWAPRSISGPDGTGRTPRRVSPCWRTRPAHVTALLGRGPAERSAPGGPAAEEDEARRIETLAGRLHGAERRPATRFPAVPGWPPLSAREPAVPGALPADPGGTRAARISTPRGGRAVERRRTAAHGGEHPDAGRRRPAGGRPRRLDLDVEALRREPDRRPDAPGAHRLRAGRLR